MLTSGDCSIQSSSRFRLEAREPWPPRRSPTRSRRQSAVAASRKASPRLNLSELPVRTRACVSSGCLSKENSPTRFRPRRLADIPDSRRHQTRDRHHGGVPQHPEIVRHDLGASPARSNPAIFPSDAPVRRSSRDSRVAMILRDAVGTSGTKPVKNCFALERRTPRLTPRPAYRSNRNSDRRWV